MDLVEQEITDQFRDGKVILSRSPFGTFGGHEVGSAYVDLFWTPSVGPSVVAFARWAKYRLRVDHPELVPVEEIAEQLGRMHLGKAAAIVRRAVQFHVADLVERGGLQVVQVRSVLPTLSDQRLQQCSAGLRALHDEHVAGGTR